MDEKKRKAAPTLHISSSLPVELNRRVSGYDADRVYITPDESSIHTRGAFWPGPLGIGRLTTDTYTLQEIVTENNEGNFHIDVASERLYTIDSNSSAILVFDAHTGDLLSTVTDPTEPERPDAVFGLTDGRLLTLFTDGRLRVLKPAAYGANLPVVFNDYCTGPYYDDFSDPTSGWPVASGPDLIYRYLNGEYNIYHVNDNQWTAVTAGHEWDNRTVQVDGRVNAGDGVYGLILGIAPDWSRFFTFEIDPVTGSWYLLRYTSASGWQLVRSGQSSAINSNWNTLRATNRELYVNIASITDFYDLNPNGRVGFTKTAWAKSRARWGLE